MKRLKFTVTAVAAAGLVTAAFAMPASAQAGIRGLAKAECKQERATDTREFVAQYGGKGKAALKRCVRREKRDATRDCKQERRFEANEFAVEYGGTDRRALKRCIRDELR
jgi:hypothetical protein